LVSQAETRSCSGGRRRRRAAGRGDGHGWLAAGRRAALVGGGTVATQAADEQAARRRPPPRVAAPQPAITQHFRFSLSHAANLETPATNAFHYFQQFPGSLLQAPRASGRGPLVQGGGVSGVGSEGLPLLASVAVVPGQRASLRGTAGQPAPVVASCYLIGVFLLRARIDVALAQPTPPHPAPCRALCLGMPACGPGVLPGLAVCLWPVAASPASPPPSSSHSPPVAPVGTVG